MNSDAFKDRLKAVIGKESNRSFAEKCGISEGTVRRYLKGEAFPPLDTLEKIADVSGCSLAWLASGEELTKGPVTAVDEALLEAIFEAVDEALDDSGLELQPRKKAQLVNALYGMFHENKKVDKGKVIQLFKLAA